MRRKTIAAVVLLAVAVAVGVVRFGDRFHRSIQWRVDALEMKLSGELTGLSWWDFFEDVLRSSTVGRQKDVTVSRVEEGDPCPVLWDTPIGGIWGRSTDGRLLRGLLGEQLNRRVYLNDIVNIAEGDVVFDVGSHLGTFTRAALDGGAKVVVAFEPEPTNIACFKKTFERELAEWRVILVEAAVSDTSGTLTFSTPPEVNSGMGELSEGGDFVVRAVTIDRVVEDLKLDRVDFIKMDIEGGERNALKGASRTLSRFSPRMSLSIYHLPDDRQVIPEIVLALQPNYQVIGKYHFCYFRP